MRYREAVAAAALLFAVPGLAFGQAAKVLPGGCGSVDLTGLDTYPLTMSTTGKQCTEGTGGGGASGNVNVTQFGSNNIVTGTGASGSGIPRVTVSNDSSVIVSGGTVTLSGIVATQPIARTSVASSALAANLVVTNAAGNLYSFTVSADSTLYASDYFVMAYDATSAPADGAVTPKLCYQVASGTRSVSASFPNPVAFTAGIVLGVSTTGCFTKTASTHAAFIEGTY